MKSKKLVMFDLDRTLTESKSKLSEDVAVVFAELLMDHDVAIISGCSFRQFETQFLVPLNDFVPDSFEDIYKLSLLPTCGSQMYLYDSGWYCTYSNNFTLKEKVNIYNAWSSSTIPHDFTCTPYGEVAEDRGSQITFSMCGQDAPLDVKEKYDPGAIIRKKIIAAMHKYFHIGEFEIKVGGTTSIDVTRKGIDKAHGVNKVLSYLNISKENAVFIGDSLDNGGNDAPVKSTGVECIETTGPEQTIEIIKSIIGDD